MDIPIYDLRINPDVNDEGAEVAFNAFVDAPAIKRDFLFFKDTCKLSFNEELRVVTGPMMVPEQLIYRNSDKLGEHYVKFSKDTIKQIAIKFSKKGYQNNVNIMHDANMQVADVTMFEMFISDKVRGISPPTAFTDMPEGTLFASYFVENEKVWANIKDGTLKGFSVEGGFDYDMPETKDEQILSELKRILNSI